MDRDRDQDRDRFEPLDALDARLNPDGRICGTLPSTPGLFPRLDDFGRCMSVQSGFGKPQCLTI